MSVHFPRRTVALAAAVILLSGLSGFLAALVMPETYSSTSRVLLGASSTAQVLGDDAGSSTSDRALATQMQVVTSDVILEPVAEAEEIRITDLRQGIDVTTSPGSSVLEISVAGDTARQAQSRTQAVTQSYVDNQRQAAVRSLRQQADSLDGAIEDLAQDSSSVEGNAESTAAALAALRERQGQLRAAQAIEQGSVSVISEAPLRPSPTSLRPLTGAVLGLAVGSVLVGVFLLRRHARSSATRSDTRETPGMGEK